MKKNTENTVEMRTEMTPSNDYDRVRPLLNEKRFTYKHPTRSKWCQVEAITSIGPINLKLEAEVTRRRTNMLDLSTTVYSGLASSLHISRIIFSVLLHG